ncbi:MAG: hypothetical protein JXA03_03900 [Bacteroidales bacterium]|nr:hypothetical protein [Bacteroidales bacterium]
MAGSEIVIKKFGKHKPGSKSTGPAIFNKGIMKLFSFICIVIFLLPVWSYATLFTVKQDGTGDYTSIQPALIYAQEGDTVIVYPGIYYENLYLTGRNVVLASLYLFTQEDWFRYHTVIDGSNEDRVIEIKYGEDNSTLICGFTIQNGYASTSGGGFYIIYSSPRIEYCIIQNNYARSNGGGIFAFWESQFSLAGNTIRYNQAQSSGGGVIFDPCTSYFAFDSCNRNNVYLNHAAYDMDIAGVSSYNCQMDIFLDTATIGYQDPYFIASRDPYGTQSNEFNIFINMGKIIPVPATLFVAPWGNDSNTGTNPNDPLQTVAFALKKIVPDSTQQRTIFLAPGAYSTSLTNELLPVGARGYIDITGSGVSETIIDAEHSAYLMAAGDNMSHFSIGGFTFINGDNNNTFGNAGIMIPKLHYKDISIKDIVFKDCISDGVGLILTYNWCEDVKLCNIEAYNCTGERMILAGTTNSAGKIHEYSSLRFYDNVPGTTYNDGEGGILSFSFMDVYGAKLRIINSAFYNNTRNPDPMWGGIYGAHFGTGNSEEPFSTDYNTIEIINCTFADNYVTNVQVPSVFNTDNGIRLDVYNTVFYNPGLYEMVLYDEPAPYPTVLTVEYSNIEDAQAGVYNKQYNNIQWGQENINANPEWLGSGEHPYTLGGNSPCINAGAPMYEWGVDPPYIKEESGKYVLYKTYTDTVHLPAKDLAGNPRVCDGRIDMGAYEFFTTGQQEQAGINDEPSLDIFPNPFTENAFLSFGLKREAGVVLMIRDIHGNPVRKLLDSNLQPGNFSITWDGSDDWGFDVATGTYIVNVEVNGISRGFCKVVKK